MASRDPARPNVLFALSDDQSTWGVGCYGNHEIDTRNLDALAAAGVRLDNFFCTSPVCSPARASLLTGRIPSQHGVHDAILDGNVGPNAVPYLHGLLTYTDVLARNGYRCGLSGKWHLGDSQRPQASLSHWFAHQREGSVYYGAPMVRDGRLVVVDDYLTDVITDDGIAFVDRSLDDDDPFYLSLHYTAPHAPWVGQHPADLVAAYDDCPFESCPQEPEHPWFRQFRDSDGRRRAQSSYMEQASANPRENLKGYFAAVTAMDRNIGRVLATLERHGLRESTLVCFLSDNGFNAGHHGIWGKGNGTRPQNMYDTSVRVPAILSQPGRIESGSSSAALLSGYDFLPTLLDFLGLRVPQDPTLPGASFAPILRGEATADREHVVVYDEYGPVRMVRTQQHKYVHRYPNGPHELYDLRDDPGERVNLVDDPARAGQVRDLRDRLRSWFDQYVVEDRDGRSEPVTGCGQMQPMWAGGRRFGSEPVDSAARHQVAG